MMEALNLILPIVPNGIEILVTEQHKSTQKLPIVPNGIEIELVSSVATEDKPLPIVPNGIEIKK